MLAAEHSPLCATCPDHAVLVLQHELRIPPTAWHEWNSTLCCRSMDIEDRTTVEGNLLRAAYEAGMILPSNLAAASRLRWSRSSRTDKGVHAVSAVSAQSCSERRNEDSVDVCTLQIGHAYCRARVHAAARPSKSLSLSSCVSSGHKSYCRQARQGRY